METKKWRLTYLTAGGVGVCQEGRGLIINVTACRENIHCGLLAEEEEEVARLIAAAPAMLEAVYMLLGCTDLNVEALDESSIDAIEQARTAIAQATG